MRGCFLMRGELSKFWETVRTDRSQRTVLIGAGFLSRPAVVENCSEDRWVENCSQPSSERLSGNHRPPLHRPPDNTFDLKL